MTKNKKNNFILMMVERLIESIRLNKIFYLACVLTFIALLTITYFTFLSDKNFSVSKLNDFAVGKVAERDIVAGRDLSYINEEATKLKERQRQAEVLPVFNFDAHITSKVLSEINSFTETFSSVEKYKGASSFANAVIEKFPNRFFERDIASLISLHDGKNYDEIIKIVSSLSKQIMDLGIIKEPDADLSLLKQDEVELITKVDNTQKYSIVKKKYFLTQSRLYEYVENILKGMGKQELTKDVLFLIEPFLTENIIFDSGATERRIQAALLEVVPVTIVIPAGETIVRQGFVVTEEMYGKLERLSLQSYSFDRRLIIGWSLFLLTLFLISTLLFSSKILGTSLSLKNRLILLVSAIFVYLIVLWLGQLKAFSSAHNLELMSVMPVTVFVMLVAILLSKKVAVLQAVVVSLLILVPLDFNFQVSIYALFSSLAGIAFIDIGEKRIDLIKTALELTFINPILAVMIIILFGNSTPLIPILFGTAINGFMTGIFILGFLPILESALNIPTNFRLMELSDLNSSVLKKMLLTVPGTYNHSILVASLSEAACRVIGANPLLARVGAYYHDIGKMENPEYFVENQTDENKHSELNPRLSATIIRSHTKLGVAHGRELHLPEEVINIIASHQGDGVISYFYHKALEKEGQNINKTDFSYPGPKPRSKEASVVMLADVVEAACRARVAKEKISDLESFFQKTIDDLVKAKIDADQLADSSLSLGEITIVKKTFVEILTGYYHSRIDYPSAKKTETKQAEAKQQEANSKAVPAPTTKASEENTRASKSLSETSNVNSNTETESSTNIEKKLAEKTNGTTQAKKTPNRRTATKLTKTTKAKSDNTNARIENDAK